MRENDDEDGSGGCVTGVIFIVLAFIAFGYLTMFEASEAKVARVRIPWSAALAYNLGGKWVASGLLFAIGLVSILFSAISSKIGCFFVIMLLCGSAGGYYFFGDKIADLNPFQERYEFRIFTSNNGRKMEARLLEFENGKVKIERRDGEIFETSIQVYSPEDRRYIQEITSQPAQTSTPNGTSSR